MSRIPYVKEAEMTEAQTSQLATWRSVQTRLALAYVTDELGIESRPLAEGELTPGRAQYTGGAFLIDEAGAIVMRKPSCQCNIHQGRATYNCGKDVVAKVKQYSSERYMCKAHLSGARRSAKNDLKRRGEERQKMDVANATQARIDALPIEGRTYYTETYTSRGRIPSSTHVVVSLDDLERLIGGDNSHA